MAEELTDRLLRQPPTTVVDLVMTANGLKTGSEILRNQRDEELERIIKEMGLIYEWKDGFYLVACSKEDITKQVPTRSRADSGSASPSAISRTIREKTRRSFESGSRSRNSNSSNGARACLMSSTSDRWVTSHAT